MLLGRSVLLFILVCAGVTLTLLPLLPLPVDPMLHVAVLLVPFVTAWIVVASWHAAGAPWPSFKKPPQL
jgi:hypothetical protein